jgi:hypothetical protein
MNLKKVFAYCALGAMAFVGGMAWAAYTEEPYTGALTAGEWYNLTDQGSTVRIIESSLTHPTHADGFVDKGDPVIWSTLGAGRVGVALESASAATDYVNIATRGIINVTMSAVTTMGIGDPVYIATSGATMEDSADSAIPFGTVLTAVASNQVTAVRAVRLADAWPGYYEGTVDIGSGASSATVTIAGLTTASIVTLTPAENISTGVVWALREDGLFDVVLTDATDGDQDNAAAAYTIFYRASIAP